MPGKNPSGETSAEYSVEEWLTECAEEAGVMSWCPDCGEYYFSEDGHPEGTLCPTFGKQSPAIAADLTPGFVTCHIHNVQYWHEDACPECNKE